MPYSTETKGTLPTSGRANGRSHFTAGSRLAGDLHVPGLVELLGHVDGKVSADAILVEESGSVDGELEAAKVAIKGQFEGKIFGGIVILHASAKVSGEIFYETLSIESGAQVNSRCAVKKPART
ncbi:MAG: cytoskeletal protein CcmA (bactofilin family) [Paracoccaceae bacterium]|jgi:cytoskeletal protein CcmA (bactofilin family)